MRKTKQLFLMTLLAALFFSCNKSNISSNELSGSEINNMKNDILKDLSTKVILATYKDLNDISEELRLSVDALKTNPTQEVLNQVREKWIATRVFWESSEGFLYGPADTKQLDPSLDSWPVDVNAMNAVINSSVEITPELLARNDDARGFHLIEYLIWGVDGNAKASDLSNRKLDYLVAAAKDLERNTQELYSAWKPNGGNYVSNFINANEGTGNYASSSFAIEEILGGIIAICDEVGNSKLATPLNIDGEAIPEEEESQFSHNSKTDFINNLTSVKNIYEGLYNGKQVASGLTKLTKLKNATLDSTIKTQIDASIKSVEDIPGTFSEAIFNNREAVSNAINTINKLQEILENQLNPLLKQL